MRDSCPRSAQAGSLVICWVWSVPAVSPQMTCKALGTELSKHLQLHFNCPDEVLLHCIVLGKL